MKIRALGGEIRDTKTLNLSRDIVSLQVLVDVSRFSFGVINLTVTLLNKSCFEVNICRAENTSNEAKL